MPIKALDFHLAIFFAHDEFSAILEAENLHLYVADKGNVPRRAAPVEAAHFGTGAGGPTGRRFGFFWDRCLILPSYRTRGLPAHLN